MRIINEQHIGKTQVNVYVNGKKLLCEQKILCQLKPRGRGSRALRQNKLSRTKISLRWPLNLKQHYSEASITYTSDIMRQESINLQSKQQTFNLKSSQEMFKSKILCTHITLSTTKTRILTSSMMYPYRIALLSNLCNKLMSPPPCN